MLFSSSFIIIYFIITQSHCIAVVFSLRKNETMELPPALTSVIDKSIEYVYSFKPLFEPTVILGTS
jgi:hypothetical protein